jgi:hypothetical protein
MDDEFGRIVSMITRKQARRGAQVRRLGYVGGLPTFVLLRVVSYSVYWDLPTLVTTLGS